MGDSIKSFKYNKRKPDGDPHWDILPGRQKWAVRSKSLREDGGNAMIDRARLKPMSNVENATFDTTNPPPNRYTHFRTHYNNFEMGSKPMFKPTGDGVFARPPPQAFQRPVRGLGAPPPALGGGGGGPVGGVPVRGAPVAAAARAAAFAVGAAVRAGGVNLRRAQRVARRAAVGAARGARRVAVGAVRGAVHLEQGISDATAYIDRGLATGLAAVADRAARVGVRAAAAGLRAVPVVAGGVSSIARGVARGGLDTVLLAAEVGRDVAESGINVVRNSVQDTLSGLTDAAEVITNSQKTLDYIQIKAADAVINTARYLANGASSMFNRRQQGERVFQPRIPAPSNGRPDQPLHPQVREYPELRPDPFEDREASFGRLNWIREGFNETMDEIRERREKHQARMRVTSGEAEKDRKIEQNMLSPVIPIADRSDLMQSVPMRPVVAESKSETPVFESTARAKETLYDTPTFKEAWSPYDEGASHPIMSLRRGADPRGQISPGVVPVPVGTTPVGAPVGALGRLVDPSAGLTGSGGVGEFFHSVFSGGGVSNNQRPMLTNSVAVAGVSAVDIPDLAPVGVNYRDIGGSRKRGRRPKNKKTGGITHKQGDPVRAMFQGKKTPPRKLKDIETAKQMVKTRAAARREKVRLAEQAAVLALDNVD